MEFLIRFETNNAAFENDTEIDRVLERVAEKIKSGNSDFKIKDSNGNSIGTCKEISNVDRIVERLKVELLGQDNLATKAPLWIVKDREYGDCADQNDYTGFFRLELRSEKREFETINVEPLADRRKFAERIKKALIKLGVKESEFENKINLKKAISYLEKDKEVNFEDLGCLELSLVVIYLTKTVGVIPKCISVEMSSKDKAYFLVAKEAEEYMVKNAHNLSDPYIEVVNICDREGNSLADIAELMRIGD